MYLNCAHTEYHSTTAYLQSKQLLVSHVLHLHIQLAALHVALEVLHIFPLQNKQSYLIINVIPRHWMDPNIENNFIAGNVEN